MHNELTCRLVVAPRGALFPRLASMRGGESGESSVHPRARPTQLAIETASPPNWCANWAALRSAKTSGLEPACMLSPTGIADRLRGESRTPSRLWDVTYPRLAPSFLGIPPTIEENASRFTFTLCNMPRHNPRLEHPSPRADGRKSPLNIGRHDAAHCR